MPFLGYKMDDFKQIEAAVEQILRAVDSDPSRQELKATPARVAEALLYLTRGYREDIDEEMKKGLFPAENHDIVALRDMEFHSLCEHHILPFYGHVSVVYIPDKSLIGISKIARIVDHFAARLQVQERMTAQIADMIFNTLAPLAVGVSITARHLCMSSRGPKKDDALMFSRAVRALDDPAKRDVVEVLSGFK